MAYLLSALSSILINIFFIGRIQAFGSLSPNDPASYSTPDFAVIRHVALKLNVDFERKVLSGYALLKFEALKNTNEVILDASDLSLECIELDNTILKYKVDGHIPNIGSKLTIQLPKEATSGDKFNIKIKYTTSPSASALQWLEPSQTKGKKFPYLFSQCSPIHARSILPCQDSPAVKFTYDAEISAPQEFTVLMSAIRGNVTINGDISTTSFRQPVPIPTNLMAIAVAVLERKSIGPRSIVWSEKEMIDQSAYEFAETESYIQAAERLCGPYVWTEYDLLVLPPSFPYGAMENPCLTFVTPTLLAGDRSQANVIAHEIAHSWTGNLVSIKNFEHFWLKEGWTVYLEIKIRASLVQDPVEAKRERDFFSLLGLEELTSEMQAIDITDPNSQPTQLVVNLTGRHPEDTYGNVPYEKGSLFIRYLEDLIGIESFEAFLRSYIDHFTNKSHDSNEFKAYLIEYFKDKPEGARVAQVDWHAWLYTTGMPPVIPKYDTTMADEVTKLLSKINTQNCTPAYNDVKNFTPHQIIYLLQQILTTQVLPIDTLENIGTAYKINDSNNTDIKYRWLRLCVRSRHSAKLPVVFEFVNSQGRTKYVRPLYRDLYAWEDIRLRAIENFLENEPNMMHVTAHTIRKELHLD